MNGTIRQLHSRKSTRAFEDRAISEDDKRQILEAAFQAPTAGCQQLYTILDITDPALREALAESCDHQPFIATAKLVLVLFMYIGRVGLLTLTVGFLKTKENTAIKYPPVNLFIG